MLLSPGLAPTWVRRIVGQTATPHPDWQGKVASGGNLDAESVLLVAAWVGLVRAGYGVEEAKHALSRGPATVDLEPLVSVVQRLTRPSQPQLR